MMYIWSESIGLWLRTIWWSKSGDGEGEVEFGKKGARPGGRNFPLKRPRPRKLEKLEFKQCLSYLRALIGDLESGPLVIKD